MRIKKRVLGKLYSVTLTCGKDKFWLAECTDLQGCVSGGKTKAKAVSMIVDAIKCYLEAFPDSNPKQSKTVPRVQLARVKA
ncbi:MAG: type II toxin-antitoxin system HicB family antitoxin [Candidatus Diapherotrites archaeon]